MIDFIVYGTPAPAGSKRFVGVSKSGRGIMVESSKAVKPWREAVKCAALDALYRQTPVHGPVILTVTFTLKKPSSAPKKRTTVPDRKPDLSKLIRSTEDALTEAGCWEDDARVVQLIAKKVFPREDPDALDIPGARIEIRAYSAERVSIGAK